MIGGIHLDQSCLHTLINVLQNLPIADTDLARYTNNLRKATCIVQYGYRKIAVRKVGVRFMAESNRILKLVVMASS